MSTQGRILRRFVLPILLKQEHRESALRHWHFFEKSQFWSRQQLLDYQWIKLKELLEHAYESSPYYTRIFNERGLTPDSIKTPDDIALLPLLSRDTIFEHFADICSTRFRPEQLLPTLSGGTTGQQTKIARDRESINIKLGMAFRHDSWSGMLPCEKMILFWPPHMDFHHEESIKTKFKNRYLLRQLMFYTGSSEKGLMRQIQAEFFRFKPDYLRVFPSALNGFLQFCEANKLPVPNVKAIISTGEPLYHQQREQFEKTLGCKVFDMYGSRELGNTANECEVHDGLHIAMETSYVEFLRDGKPVTPGEEGELVITDLTNYAFPMIRYRINDYGKQMPGDCACGRGLQKMSPGVGRLSDDLWKADGTRVSGVTPGVHITADPKHPVGQLQIIQKSITSFELRVGKNPPPTPRMLEFIETQMKNIFGKNTQVRFEIMEEIPLEPSGKFRFTKCEIEPPAIADHNALMERQ